jgi:hypothetical protein
MPSVVHLGSFGDQRPSDLSGLSDAIAKGAELGTRVSTIRAKQAADAADAAAKQRQYELEKAKSDLDKEKTHLEMSDKLLNQVSELAFKADPSYVNGQSTTKNMNLQNFEQTPNYQQYRKLLKKYGAEGSLNEDGTIQYKSSKEYGDAWIPTFKAAYLAKHQAGLPTTPAEDTTFNLANADPGLRAQIGKLLEGDPRFMQAQADKNDTEMANLVESYLGMFSRTGNVYTKGLSGGASTNSNDPNDPLGLKQR